MLDLIKQEIKSARSREAKVHLTREFLQLLTLKIFFDRGIYKNLAFVGGTALRFLFGLRRFSEDLDFSLVRKPGYNFDEFIAKTIYELKKAGFSVDIKKSTEGSVQSAFLKFNELLYLLGLSELKSQKLSIKLEVDSNPPPGWKTGLSLVSKHFVFTVTHFDLPSLFAAKLHACLFRQYLKGRDFYDLLWYLGKNIIPNFELLNNAIEQTQHEKLNLSKENYKDFLREHLSQIDFTAARKDVERFIEDKNELKLLNKEVILKLIR